MKSTLTPAIARGVTREELKVTFGATGSRLTHDVVVPAGTRVRQLQGGQSAHWVVEDIGFITDKNSLTYHDAKYYGIPVADDQVANIAPVTR